jgi:NitT/TauT family transport system substrate-binding protein
MGTGSEIFWRRVVEKRGWKVADFTMVNVEAPEMLAATERGDIDGFAVWEPWPTRTLMAVKGTKVLQTAEGIYNNINFVYMNRGWIEQNKATAEKFMLSLVQANDLIEKDRPAAAKMVAKFLKMPLELATELMPKVEFDMDWRPRSIESIQVAEKQLADQKKLKAPLDYSKYVYLDLLKAVRPQNVQITALPK